MHCVLQVDERLMYLFQFDHEDKLYMLLFHSVFVLARVFQSSDPRRFEYLCSGGLVASCFLVVGVYFASRPVIFWFVDGVIPFFLCSPVKS